MANYTKLQAMKLMLNRLLKTVGMNTGIELENHLALTVTKN